MGFHALFPTMQPAWLPRAIASSFLVLAIVVIVLAERRAAAVMRRLDAHVLVTARAVNLRLFAVMVSIGAAALMVAIWFFDVR